MLDEDCIYYNEWGCLRSKECICDKKIKKENSKVFTSQSGAMGEQAMEDSISKRFKEMINCFPSPDQFKDIK